MFGGFVAGAAERATAAGRPAPRVRLVVMGTDEESRAYHERYLDVLSTAGVPEVLVERVPEGSPCPAATLEDIDGLLVGGGPTPEYHASLAPLFPRIRDLVAAGTPYAGFSAGAAIAGTTAIVGGWRIDGEPVCPEDSNEELDAVTVVPGIGLVDGAVDVHASQWGTLSRLVAATGAGLVPGGVAIDECTTLEPGSGTVTGAGRVWRVEREGDWVRVQRS